MLCDGVVEWTSPVNRAVDISVCYKYQPGVKDCLGYVPRPPLYKPLKQKRGRSNGEVFCSNQFSAEQLADARQAYRFHAKLYSVYLMLVSYIIHCVSKNLHP